eukprot:m.30810 g.30810  ORF g.30810 m.30810 type:complete len:311 (+) comp8242_c0_seq2:342-1274(+)
MFQWLTSSPRVSLVVMIIALVVVIPLLLEVVIVMSTGSGMTKRAFGISSLTRKLLHPKRVHQFILLAVLAFIFGAIFAHWSGLVLHEQLFEIIMYHLTPSIWINMGMLYHLFMAVITNAGSFTEILEDEPVQPEVSTPTWCSKCRRHRPSDAFHCSVCGRCSRFMDHHCPFTANCVGRDNFRYFFAFVLWSWIATVYAVWLTRVPRRICHPDNIHTNIKCKGWAQSTGSLYFASVASLVSLSAFLGFNIYLLLTKQTTRAFLTGRKQTVLKDRSLSDALQIRLGPTGSWWRYLLPGFLRSTQRYPAKHTN